MKQLVPMPLFIFFIVMWNIFNRKKNKLPSLHDQYLEIMREFNFQRVAEFMNKDDSMWSYNDDGSYTKTKWAICVRTPEKNVTFAVPTSEELKLLASELLLEVINAKSGNYYSVASGPFKVIKRFGVLELDCIIESWYGVY